MQVSVEFQIAVVVYVVIVARWFSVITKYHKDVLANDSSFQYKDHPIFKTILGGRALVLAAVAPLMAFINPSYFNQFFQGVEVKGRAGVVTGLLGSTRTVK